MVNFGQVDLRILLEALSDSLGRPVMGIEAFNLGHGGPPLGRSASGEGIGEAHRLQRGGEGCLFLLPTMYTVRIESASIFSPTISTDSWGYLPELSEKPQRSIS